MFFTIPVALLVGIVVALMTVAERLSGLALMGMLMVIAANAPQAGGLVVRWRRSAFTVHKGT